MPHIDFIQDLLDLKDQNIIISENCYSEEKIKGIIHKIINAKLIYNPIACYKCGHIKDDHIVKHGFKTSHIKTLSTAGFHTILRLDKQRYRCRHCNSTFTLKTSLVNDGCFISNNTKLSIALDAKKKVSEKDLALNHNVSHSTVSRIIDNAYEAYKVNKNYLPTNLCFDEFKSVKSTSGAMSFLFVNADSGEIIDIVEDRKLEHLKRYFLSFSKSARRAVRNIVIDMYSPYMTLIKSLFPNAKIVIDKFHLVQLFSRALNKTRIRIMNQSDKHYNKFKKFWKLILKDRNKLDTVRLQYNRTFRKQMREIDIVDFLMEQNTEFKASYTLYQDILTAIKLKNISLLESILSSENLLVSSYMITSLKTVKKYKKYIINMFQCQYTNGVIEGINNKIKVIKRIAFGYRSYVHFRNRILITQGILKIKAA
ncbi:MAG: ISL3 family transposase [Clostridia bacterium]|nr:ISL3 family transposase [Clostridia bacterium]